ncbi:acyltransferase family protein [Kordiimonas aestuarii]|uniref:acyltransferase family protein n=1 Tax=Kordiimonas aestuarii TaxID=1005925 RepID=UPI0021D13660|nr:acyltransferase family protein [Kordiimonas aestuarii]
MNTSFTSRRYDLDWLRVIAFGLLIFYHVGMYYVTWGWHVKSPYESTFLEPFMMLLNPWRLPLLFVISGIAVRYAADKVAAGGFAWSRFKRLMIPLLFGSFFIVPPQTYFELLHGGVIEPGYWSFYKLYVDFGRHWEVATPTYNHLWYVMYVLIYTMLAIPLLAVMRRVRMPTSISRVLASPLIVVLPVLPFIFYRFTVDMQYPETHDFMNDPGGHIRYGSWFLLGLLCAKSGHFWAGIGKHWKLALGAAVLTGGVLTPVWLNWDALVVDSAQMQIARAARVAYMWWVIAALFGVAEKYLNRPSPALSYLTEAVFPYYILHQTVIILIGVALAPYLIGAVPEFLMVMLGTAGCCAVLHEYAIRRVAILRPLFGLKSDRAGAVSLANKTA